MAAAVRLAELGVLAVALGSKWFGMSRHDWEQLQPADLEIGLSMRVISAILPYLRPFTQAASSIVSARELLFARL